MREVFRAIGLINKNNQWGLAILPKKTKYFFPNFEWYIGRYSKRDKMSL